MNKIFLIFFFLNAFFLGSQSLVQKSCAEEAFQDYILQAPPLTESDFQLFIKYMALKSNPNQAEIESGLERLFNEYDCAHDYLNNLTPRITFGQLIIDDPMRSVSLVSQFGPNINPSDSERELFKKYETEIKRYLR
jgi:hypothetical protein